jgi:hypothetical protein
MSIAGVEIRRMLLRCSRAYFDRKKSARSMMSVFRSRRAGTKIAKTLSR